MEIAKYLVVGAIGLLFGSFANVLIVRIPAGKSIVTPPSHCPHCGHPLRALDLVPVLSWLFLKGKCRYCQGRISPRYPLIELLTAALFVGVFMRWGLSAFTLAGWVLVIILVSAAFIDLDEGIIPDVITIPGVILGLAVSFFTIGFLPALWGALAFGGVLFVAAVISQGGMGGGDIKLAAAIGAFCGLPGALITLLLSSLLGTLFGIILIMMGRAGRKTPVKFGPFLAVSAYIAFLFSNEIVMWYLGRW
ncbi:MAG TPA: prepilin peptidase [Syntrophomonadaceae bacterium]|nr:prepilin peptidase [Syntrophomonadaceae bacterium]